MAQRGKPSTAHEYDKRNQCIYCGMHRINVEGMSHVCTPQREAEQDKADELALLDSEIKQVDAGGV